jgi:hypothetical protein
MQMRMLMEKATQMDFAMRWLMPKGMSKQKLNYLEIEMHLDFDSHLRMLMGFG